MPGKWVKITAMEQCYKHQATWSCSVVGLELVTHEDSILPAADLYYVKVSKDYGIWISKLQSENNLRSFENIGGGFMLCME